MADQIEGKLQRELEVKLGPWIDKWETPVGSTTRHTFVDGYLRAFSCIAIAAVGIWFALPLRLLCGWRDPIGTEAASVVALAFPLTIIYAFRATDKLCCAYQDSEAPNKRKHLPWIVVTVLVCWAPTIVYLIVAVGALVHAYVR